MRRINTTKHLYAIMEEKNKPEENNDKPESDEKEKTSSED